MNAYLDNSATTKPSAAVAAAVRELMEGGWYNPSALYKPALEIQKKLDGVRETCLKAAGAQGQKVIFTSGGTEADNLALLGHLKACRKPGKVLISSVEHPAVSACAEEIRKIGHTVEEIPASRSGSVDMAALEGMLDDSVLLISVMQVNNETGTAEPLAEIAALRDRKVPGAAIHVDGVQGADYPQGPCDQADSVRRWPGGEPSLRHRKHLRDPGVGRGSPELGSGCERQDAGPEEPVTGRTAPANPGRED